MLLESEPGDAPKEVEDDIYPVFPLDDNETLRGIVVTWTLHFNDVLDAQRLHDSLWRLLEIGDWRKLGGRLRMRADKKLEIYVPRTFTSARPPLRYSHAVRTTSIQDDALGKTLPSLSADGVFHDGPRKFQTFAVADDNPKILADYLKNDVPQISLHVTSFTNATLVGVSWPHTLMDVMGQQALLHAWSLIINGRESEVPAVLGARKDAVEQLLTDARVNSRAEEPLVLQSQRLSTFGMIGFGLRFAWGLLREPAAEERAFCLKRRDVDVLVQEAQADLDAITPAGGERPFVSEGDVLTAFFVRALARVLPSPRPIIALHALNLRFRLPSLANAAGVHLQNMAIGAFLLLGASESTDSLGKIALENRRCLAEQATEPQALAYLNEIFPATGSQRAALDPAKLVFGPPDGLLVPFTNWTRAEFAKTADFAGAVVSAGQTSEARKNPPGTLVYHHASSMVGNAGAKNVFVLLGGDHASNQWITASLLPVTWTSIEKEILRLRGTSGV
jgi:hypothetical protein